MDLLPIFPLELVFFPEERLNLHIFEPRYKQLILDCKDSQTSFGIPLFHRNSLYTIACEAFVDRIFKTYSDGRMDIQVRGARRFEILRSRVSVPGKLYAAAEILWLPNYKESATVNMVIELLRNIKLVYKWSGIEKAVAQKPEDFRLAHVIHYLGLTIEQEYYLLEMASEKDQVQYLIEHTAGLIVAFESTSRMQDRVAMNGHFKELESPF
jgi:Lon protease-like protein